MVWSPQYAPLPGRRVEARPPSLPVVSAPSSVVAASAPARATTCDVSAAAFAGISDAAHLTALRALYVDVNPEKLAQVWHRVHRERVCGAGALLWLLVAQRLPWGVGS